MTTLRTSDKFPERAKSARRRRMSCRHCEFFAPEAGRSTFGLCHRCARIGALAFSIGATSAIAVGAVAWALAWLWRL